MVPRLCLLTLLTVLPARAYVLGSPQGPASCQEIGRDRILILVDPAAGPNPEIKTAWNWNWQREITLPKPVAASGLYEYPSCKLIYPLEGWSKFEMPETGGKGRFLLRVVRWLTEDGRILPPPAGKPVPFGLALYDGGRLVRHFKEEEIFEKYADELMFSTTASGADRNGYESGFDEGIQAWRITTQRRGPEFFQRSLLRCYWESYTWDARTGKVLSSWRVDWILWGSGLVLVLVTGTLLLILRHRRKKRRSEMPG